MKHIYKILFILIVFLCLNSIVHAQEKQNGFTRFYYGNGALSSEGSLIDGKPDGYWKTYFINGKIKSEGNRKNFLLDSLWVFYDESGLKEKEINYYNGKKNGYLFTYNLNNSDSSKAGSLFSKELYVEDVKQGLSYYYYSDGKIHKIVPYKDGKKDGIIKEFSKDSVIITLIEYHKDIYLDREKINRKDKNGLKQGMWKDFYSNDKVKTESPYIDNLLNGYYREYDITGKLLKEIKYEKGIEITDTVSVEKIEQKNLYFESGKIKYSGAYKDSIPVGIHREFNEQGEIIKAFEYNNRGQKTGEGICDMAGNKQGKWLHYFDDGNLQSVGSYKNNKKHGPWTYYYPGGGGVEETGSYVNGKPDGNWKWCYRSGKILREENFEKGKEEGPYIEYSEEGTIICKGEFLDGEKEGFWFCNIGDYREEGNYKGGMQEGIWKWYYHSGVLQFEGKYTDGEPEGVHKFFYETGKLKTDGKYLMGKKEGNWRHFSEEGYLETVFTYKNGKEIKVDGMKWKWPEEKKDTQ